MRLNSIQFCGLIALSAFALHGQSTIFPPTNGPMYWATTEPTCSALNDGETATQISNGGWVCTASGTFVWFASGGPSGNSWSTSILLSAPASNPIGVDYEFYDLSGNNLSMDTTVNGGAVNSTNEVDFALAANQPSVLNVLGATSDASTGYSTLTDGTVYVQIYCPDEPTCENALPQLIYSALPTYPWSLSVPIGWYADASNVWSAVGINNGSTQVMSMAICNYGSAAAAFNVYVYDSSGSLVGSGTTPSIPGTQSTTYECGTNAFLLSSIVSNLPNGPMKVLVDGGTNPSYVEMLQINGSSATTLQVAFDTAPSSGTAGALRRQAHPHAHNLKVFPPLPR